MFKIANRPVELVVLRCPYMNMDNEETRNLFTKMMFLKYKGYGNRHFAGSLPLDTTDYVADHPLICVRDDENKLVPVSGSKVITYDACKYFNLEFAMESCFKKSGKGEHLEVLFDIINTAQSNNKTIAYHGGYTIDPKFGTNAEDRDLIRDLFMGTTALYFLENNISELLGLGVPKFKTENFFYQWGYERCTKNKKELESFPLHFLPETDGVMMHLNQFSPNILLMSKKYQALWDKRIYVGDNTPMKKAEKLAA